MDTSTSQVAASWVQAAFAVLSFVTTALIAVVGWKISLNQLKPFLYFDTTTGIDHTIIVLKNEGLGPANIRRVIYRLKARKKEEYHRCKPGDPFEPERLDTETDRNKGYCHYLLEAKAVIPEAAADWTKRVSSTKDYWQTCNLAGVVVGAGREHIILQAYIKYDPNKKLDPVADEYAPENRPGKQWQAALRNKLAYGQITIEYENALRSDHDGCSWWCFLWKPYTMTHTFVFPELRPKEVKLLEALEKHAATANQTGETAAASSSTAGVPAPLISNQTEQVGLQEPVSNSKDTATKDDNNSSQPSTDTIITMLAPNQVTESQ